MQGTCRQPFVAGRVQAPNQLGTECRSHHFYVLEAGTGGVNRHSGQRVLVGGPIERHHRDIRKQLPLCLRGGRVGHGGRWSLCPWTSTCSHDSGHHGAHQELRAEVMTTTFLVGRRWLDNEGSRGSVS